MVRQVAQRKGKGRKTLNKRSPPRNVRVFAGVSGLSGGMFKRQRQSRSPARGSYYNSTSTRGYSSSRGYTHVKAKEDGTSSMWNSAAIDHSRLDEINKFITSDIAVPKFTYPFDRKKADDFIRIAEIALGNSSEPYNNAAYFKLLMQKTEHVSWDTFMHNLVLAVKNFCRTVTGDFVLYIPYNNNKSNYWISQIVYHLLPRKPIRVALYVQDILPGIPILLCDDGVYSAQQISDAFYMLLNKNRTNQEAHLISAYMSSFAVEQLMYLFTLISESTQSTKTLSIYYTVLMKPLIDPIDVAPDSECHGKDKTALMTGHYRRSQTRFNFADMYCSKTKQEFRNILRIPIYFDHKLPDTFSSFPGIYAYNELIQLWKRKGLLSGLDLKPAKGGMIIGCNPTKTGTQNACPPPPYKKKSPENTLLLSPRKFVKKYSML